MSPCGILGLSSAKYISEEIYVERNDLSKVMGLENTCMVEGKELALFRYLGTLAMPLTKKMGTTKTFPTPAYATKEWGQNFYFSELL